jgi:hypothetical protein
MDSNTDCFLASYSLPPCFPLLPHSRCTRPYSTRRDTAPVCAQENPKDLRFEHGRGGSSGGTYRYCCQGITFVSRSRSIYAKFHRKQTSGRSQTTPCLQQINTTTMLRKIPIREAGNGNSSQVRELVAGLGQFHLCNVFVILAAIVPPS